MLNAASFRSSLLVYFVVLDVSIVVTSRVAAGSSGISAPVVKYNTTVVVFLVELAKWLLASACVRFGYCVPAGSKAGQPDRCSTDWGTYLRYACPALFYAAQNNLNLIAIAYCGAAVFALFQSSKVLFSAGINKLLLSQKFNMYQRWALALLTLALVVSRAGDVLLPNRADAQLPPMLLTGICMVLLTSLLSALNGGINEFLLKKVDLEVPLMQKNVWIYQWGALLNFVAVLVSEWPFDGADDGNPVSGAGVGDADVLGGGGGLPSGDALWHLLRGFSPVVVFLIMLYSLFGLTVSLVLQHFDNVVRAVSSVVPLFMSVLCGRLLFDEPEAERPVFWLAVSLAAAGVALYQRREVASGKGADDRGHGRGSSSIELEQQL